MTPTRMGLHSLAHELHMTVGQLTTVMTFREYCDWVSWFDAKHKAQEKETKQTRHVAPGGFSFDLTSDAGVAELAKAFKGKTKTAPP